MDPEPIIETPQPKKNRKLKIIIIAAALVLVISGVLIFLLTRGKTEDIRGEDLLIPNMVLDENGIPKHIEGHFTDVKIKSGSDALSALEDIKDLMKIKNVQNEFRVLSETSSEGISYYKLQQQYKGIDVHSQQLIFSVDKDGTATSLGGHYIPNISVDIEPKISKESAEISVKNMLGGNVKIVTNDMYVYADEIYNDLVYIIDAMNDISAEQFIIDAESGELITRSDLMQYSAYNFTGEGLQNQEYDIVIEEFQEPMLLEKMYRFVDPLRKISISDGDNIGMDAGGIIISSISSNSTPIAGQINANRFIYSKDTDKNKETVKTAITTMKLFADIYDFYENVLGLKSYDNAGSDITVNIQIKKSTFSKEIAANAAWLGVTKQFYIGGDEGVSFSVAKDVIAHEFTHAVSGGIAKLDNSPSKADINKAFETGALNEAYSDIMGSLIEGTDFEMGNPTFSKLIGRNLRYPEMYQKPSKKDGMYYYPNYYMKEGETPKDTLKRVGSKKGNLYDHYDQGGIHHNATVPGHAAYLMYTAGAFDSKELMAKVWYNSLFKLSNDAKFENCALGVIEAAGDLGLSKSSIAKIEKAFIDTNMLEKTIFGLGGRITDNDDGKQLANVKVTVVHDANNSIISIRYTDETGTYKFDNLPKGQYTITYEKDGYKTIEQTIVVDKDNLWRDIKMSKDEEKKNSDKEKDPAKDKTKDQPTSTTNACKNVSYAGHTITIFFMEGIQDGKFTENTTAFCVPDGKSFVDLMNDASYNFPDWIVFDGTTLTIKGMESLSANISYYYRGTDTLYDWTTKVTEDIELEMKMFNGLIDNDLLKKLEGL